MKLNVIAQGLFIVLLLTFLSSCHQNQLETPKESKPVKAATLINDTDRPSFASEGGFALVELYTSEGCSSCPPADELANRIAKDAEENQERIFVLPFHVDYWNRLGWQDRFSSKAYSQRQYWYANRFNSPSVYTPQMIVNGKREFVGSRSAQAQEAIQAALKKSAGNSVQLKIEDQENSESFAYQILGEFKGLQLHYALIEKNVQSNVTAGENRGRNLYHYSVVTAFQSMKEPAQKGTVKLASLSTKNKAFSIIAFLQDPGTAEILAADKIDRNIE